ncbi:YbhB/YbcL family Raf kinase inhibitor-like protein [Uliginosibacterium sp. H1]|uniref:YbhB/YbcL family Raf kinase inhibitor-like protein n=1 Tax=Uliginosibacterium sp. H1 TaxID=3114757 RepID=UPI002E190946|nr:YbhB/YbcL family Raf kinase inhibitor-like protein [Uliginosibacterium sp. H1]
MLYALAIGLPCLPAAALELGSNDIKDGGSLTVTQVYKGFGCEGENRSPQLHWKNAPAGTKSFAVTVYDPDAPTGSGWWHWLVWDIPASATSLPAGIGQGAVLPAGAREGRSDYGTTGFGGACPPKGDKPHRYVFTVFALKVPRLQVPDNPTAALVGFMLNANALEKASFTATYGH